jgi:hypothetical protein
MQRIKGKTKFRVRNEMLLVYRRRIAEPPVCLCRTSGIVNNANSADNNRLIATKLCMSSMLKGGGGGGGGHALASRRSHNLQFPTTDTNMADTTNLGYGTCVSVIYWG